QTDELDRDFIRLAQALLRNDWTAQKNAANAILKHIPDFYEAFYFRGEALVRLNDPAAARGDLTLFLEKALESPLRPQARQMLGSLSQ
ncbi:MAG TPA: tetratricopeptide repeat protein, partial [Lacunisphaera sp.]|nr:tetratricopeptide repeat protein [Lacunisphaera sp.]